MVVNTTHIRIPKTVKTRLDNLASHDEPTGAVISRLIDFYERHKELDGCVNADVNNGVNAPISYACRQTESLNSDALLSFRDDIRVLNNLFSYLEGDVNAIKGQLSDISNLKESISKLWDFVVLKLNALDKEEVKIRPKVEKMEMGTDTEKTKNTGVNIRVNLRVNAEKISITPELQREIISHVNSLKDSGLSKEVIAEKAGINPNSFKGMLGTSGTRRTISPEQLKALMLINPGDG